MYAYVCVCIDTYAVCICWQAQRRLHLAKVTADAPTAGQPRDFINRNVYVDLCTSLYVFVYVDTYVLCTCWQARRLPTRWI